MRKASVHFQSCLTDPPGADTLAFHTSPPTVFTFMSKNSREKLNVDGVK